MLYLHIPFCRSKCHYCAFYSRPASDSLMHTFAQALTVEIQLRHSEITHPIRTLYLGGGTPSILPLSLINQILTSLHRHFDLSRLEEATLEANPEHLSPSYLASLRSLGFNRLSLGIQRGSDADLQLLGRRHTVGQSLAAIDAALAAGFSNLSLDFIYGLPSPPDFLHFPLQAISHVSAYALTLEPRTALELHVKQGRLALPTDDEVARQYHQVRQWLASQGFIQYEVSNFSLPGKQSIHNSRYWNRTPYLGLGPSAHSFNGSCRSWNLASTARYIAALTSPSPTLPIEGHEILTPADDFNELLMTSLRTTRGLPLASVPASRLATLIKQAQPYINCGWLQSTPSHLQPTGEGLLHADGIAASLFV
ncbi:MAG: radical SAM family heme chaperone HemW [Bacteroidales bacterium]|nr:radical SAM family heme chaperone HemW [Bacteroidales bacterium]